MRSIGCTPAQRWRMWWRRTPAEIIDSRWPVAIDPPELPGKPWTMTLTVD